VAGTVISQAAGGGTIVRAFVIPQQFPINADRYSELGRKLDFRKGHSN